MNKKIMGRSALILVGGYGTRLRPLTLTVPKPLIPFVNKPMLCRLIDKLYVAGCTRVILATSSRDPIIENIRKECSYPDLEIFFSYEDFPLGTAGPIKLARDYLRYPCFVLNSDIICDFPFEEMIDFHLKKNCMATILTTKVTEPSKYGVILTENNSDIVSEFVEKPEVFVGNKINAGVYVINEELIDLIGEGECSIEKEVFPLIAAARKLRIYDLKGPWMDIGQPKDYLEGVKMYFNNKNLINKDDLDAENYIFIKNNVQKKIEFLNKSEVQIDNEIKNEIIDIVKINTNKYNKLSPSCFKGEDLEKKVTKINKSDYENIEQFEKNITVEKENLMKNKTNNREKSTKNNINNEVTEKNLTIINENAKQIKNYFHENKKMEEQKEEHVEIKKIIENKHNNKNSRDLTLNNVFYVNTGEYSNEKHDLIKTIDYNGDINFYDNVNLKNIEIKEGIKAFFSNENDETIKSENIDFQKESPIETFDKDNKFEKTNNTREDDINKKIINTCNETNYTLDQNFITKKIKKEIIPENIFEIDMKKTYQFFLHNTDKKNQKIRNAIIHKSVQIGIGCELGDNVVIGKNVRIGNYVRIKNSTIMEGCKINDSAFIDSSIIGWNSVISKWARVDTNSILGSNVTVNEGISLRTVTVLPFKNINSNETDKILM